MHQASVVIPVFNGSVWATDLDSSLNENAESIGEVLLINDGDAHDFQKLVNRLSTKSSFPIRTFSTQGKCGPGYTRNIGLCNAKFPLIAFLDCDDIWLRGSLKMRINALLSKENSYAFVCTSFFKITASGEKKNKITPPYHATASKILITNHVFLSSVVIKKDLLEGIRFEQIGHEDLLFWVHIILNSGKPALCMNEPLCLMRTSPNSVSSVKSRSAAWHWAILRRFKIPFPLIHFIFLLYSANAFAKRIKANYRPFYFNVEKLLERHLIDTYKSPTLRTK